jgi:hypothetical protein
VVLASWPAFAAAIAANVPFVRKGGLMRRRLALVVAVAVLFLGACDIVKPPVSTARWNQAIWNQAKWE